MTYCCEEVETWLHWRAQIPTRAISTALFLRFSFAYVAEHCNHIAVSSEAHCLRAQSKGRHIISTQTNWPAYCGPPPRRIRNASERSSFKFAVSASVAK